MVTEHHSNGRSTTQERTRNEDDYTSFVKDAQKLPGLLFQ